MRFFRPVPRLSVAQPGQADLIAGLHRRAWEARDSQPDLRAGPPSIPTPAEVRAWMLGGFELYCALLESQPVGSVRCCFPVSVCYFDRLVVEPAQARRGFGRYLVEHVVSRTQRAGLNRVWTVASPLCEPAVGLLGDLDFKVAGRHRPPAGGDELLLFELRL